MTTQRVVRRIDHVCIAADDVGSVFELLRDRLGLAVMTPVTSIPESWWGYPTTAWLNLGNVPLEILEPPRELQRPAGPLEVNVLVFEPEPIEAAVAELMRRGIAHSPPQRYDFPEGINQSIPNVASPAARKPEPGSPHGTQLFLHGFAEDNVGVVCYEWAFVPVSAMRDVMRRDLDESPSRPLGIETVAEVVLGATDFDAERRRWQALLDPLREDEPGLWDFGDGPALRLVQHERDAVVGVKLQVVDLAGAERYLEERGMLASNEEGELAISRESLNGLRLILVGR